MKSIYRVPLVLRKDNEDAYSPQLVCIGPFWDIQVYEKSKEFKSTYEHAYGLYYFFVKFGVFEQKILQFFDKSKALDAKDIRLRRHELVNNMTSDACFIIAVLSSEKEKNEASIHYQHYGEREDNDVVSVSIMKDLLLLENQIPFFVLKHIFESTVLKAKPNASLIDYIKQLLEFGHRSLFKGRLRIPDGLIDRASDDDHLLSLLHKCYRPDPTEFSISLQASKTSEASKILNAMELKKAGVSFRPNQHTSTSWPLAIEIKFSRGFPWFWAEPTLKIPILKINVGTEVLLRNIIAYEQTSKVDRYFTSFMAAIDDLVDSRDDIAMLVESKIIVNDLESNEEASNMINKICKKALTWNFYHKQWEDLDTYYNQYTTVVRRTYFSNPWNSINLLAGIILFFLSAIQTYFAINPRK